MLKYLSGKRGIILLTLFLLVLVAAGFLVYNAGFLVGKSSASSSTPGSSGDPVASLSYLNDTFKPALQQEIDAAIAAKESEWQAKMDAELSDLAARLSQNTSVKSDMVRVDPILGQIIQIKQGTQFLVTEGTFSIESGTLIDVTDGKTASSITNLHVFAASGSDAYIKVKSNTAVVIIDGQYEFKG